MGLGGDSGDNPDGPTVDPDRFLKNGYFVDHWVSQPNAWEDETPERLLLSKETRAQIENAIEALPPTQRQVITLRDIEEVSSQEVCNILDITETNQRVLLHRARSKVRRTLEPYMEGQTGRT